MLEQPLLEQKSSEAPQDSRVLKLTKQKMRNRVVAVYEEHFGVLAVCMVYQHLMSTADLLQQNQRQHQRLAKTYMALIVADVLLSLIGLSDNKAAYYAPAAIYFSARLAIGLRRTEKYRLAVANVVGLVALVTVAACDIAGWTPEGVYVLAGMAMPFFLAAIEDTLKALYVYSCTKRQANQFKQQFERDREGRPALQSSGRDGELRELVEANFKAKQVTEEQKEMLVKGFSETAWDINKANILERYREVSDIEQGGVVDPLWGYSIAREVIPSLAQKCSSNMSLVLAIKTWLRARISGVPKQGHASQGERGAIDGRNIITTPDSLFENYTGCEIKASGRSKVTDAVAAADDRITSASTMQVDFVPTTILYHGDPVESTLRDDAYSSAVRSLVEQRGVQKHAFKRVPMPFGFTLSHARLARVQQAYLDGIASLQDSDITINPAFR